MKNGTKKRRAGRVILIVVLVAALVAGGTFGAIRLAGRSGGEVNVYPVRDFSTDADWMAENETEGFVSTDRIQSIYLSSTQQITEIYVEEGQEVHEGDPLLAFDTTLSELELHRQAIKVDQLKLDIDNAEKQLAEIGTYRIGSPAVYTPTYTAPTYTSASYMPYDRAPSALGTADDPLIWLWNDSCVMDEAFFLRIAALAAAHRAEAAENGGEDPAETEPTAAPEEPGPAETEAPADPEPPAATEAPATTPEPESTPEPAPEPTPEPEPESTTAPEEDESAAALPEARRLLGAAALRADRRIVLRAAEEPADPADPELSEAIDDPYIYIVFEVRTSDAPDGTLERVWEMVLSVDEETGSWSARFVEPSYDPGDSAEDYVDTGDSYVDTNIYYTAAEIAQMKAECNQKIKDLKIALKAAELEYERLEYELSGGEVVSKIDGVVKTVRDPDEARRESKPVVLVSGGGGYYVTAALGEMDLGTMAVGDTVTVRSWENYAELEGVITEISEYPDESGQLWFYGEGNQNVSTYPFKVFVSEDAELREGEYVSVTYSAAGDDSGGLYLEMPFIRQENGRSYVYTVGDDGLLEKRYVPTGRNLWGSYVEILGGLTEEDSVAFPYGRQTKDGAKVRYAEADELWSSARFMG